MKRIGVTTEGAADLKQDLIERYNIGIVDFKTGTSVKNIFKEMRETQKPIKTSQPSIAQYLQLFKKKLEEFEEIIHIATSARVSGAFNSAMQARKFLGGNSERVHILDSEKSSAAQGLLVLRAQQDILKGFDLKQIIDNFNKRVKQTFVFFMYDDPKWLKAGGRYPKIVQIGLQKIKDFNMGIVMREKQGVIKPVAFKRNIQNIVDPLFEEFKKFVGDKKTNVVITHGDNKGIADKLRQKLKELENIKILYTELLDTALGAHIGPDALILSFDYE